MPSYSLKWKASLFRAVIGGSLCLQRIRFSNRFVGHFNPTIEHHFLDIPVAQCKGTEQVREEKKREVIKKLKGQDQLEESQLQELGLTKNQISDGMRLKRPKLAVLEINSLKLPNNSLMDKSTSMKAFIAIPSAPCRWIRLLLFGCAHLATRRNRLN